MNLTNLFEDVYFACNSRDRADLGLRGPLEVLGAARGPGGRLLLVLLCRLRGGLGRHIAAMSAKIPLPGTLEESSRWGINSRFWFR